MSNGDHVYVHCCGIEWAISGNAAAIPGEGYGYSFNKRCGICQRPLSCNQSECGQGAAARFTWPGNDEAGTCAAHLPKLRAVAEAIGLHLQIHEIEPRPQIEVGLLTGTIARLRHFSRELDVHGSDRDLVARVAGCLLDLAESLERSRPKDAP